MLVHAPKSFIVAGLAIFFFCVATGALHSKTKNILSRGIGTWEVNTALRSKDIEFGDWITLFSLCLAPVIAHLLAGVPEPTILSGAPPRWLDRVCHYNPTSILWRYFVILDRRLRCRKWSAEDMAASNVYFWTGKSWDTSEDMLIRNRLRLIHKPSSVHIDWLSSSAMQTLIVTVQAGQSLYYILLSMTSMKVAENYAIRLSLANILQPFAIFGLLRLPAAYSLSESHAYQCIEDSPSLLSGQYDHGYKTMSSDSSIDMSTHMHPTNSPAGLTTRILFPVPLVALAGYSAYSLFPFLYPTRTSAAWLAHVAFFSAFLITTIVIFVVQFISGKSTTTIIPCHGKLWYKMFTGMLYLGMVVLVVLAAMETRKSQCGTWTMTVGVDEEPCAASGDFGIFVPGVD